MPLKKKKKNDTVPPVNVKTVYLIRHGQSKGQAAKQNGMDRKRDPTLRDCGLTRKGRQQAMEIPSHLSKQREDARSLSPVIDLVISSPLTRALETAIIGFHHLHDDHPLPPPILVHYGLREIGSSIPENIPRGDIDKTLKYIQERNSEAMNTGMTIDTTTLKPANWPHDVDDSCTNHHEQYDHHHVPKSERIQRIFHRIATERSEQCIVVVCHYNVIRAALAAHSNGGSLRPKNALPIQCHLYPDGTLRACDG